MCYLWLVWVLTLGWYVTKQLFFPTQHCWTLSSWRVGNTPHNVPLNPAQYSKVKIHMSTKFSHCASHNGTVHLKVVFTSLQFEHFEKAIFYSHLSSHFIMHKPEISHGKHAIECQKPEDFCTKKRTWQSFQEVSNNWWKGTNCAVFFFPIQFFALCVDRNIWIQFDPDKKQFGDYLLG